MIATNAAARLTAANKKTWPKAMAFPPTGGAPSPVRALDVPPADTMAPNVAIRMVA